MKKSCAFLDCFGGLYEEIAPRVLRELYGADIANAIRKSIFPRIDLGTLTLEEGWAEIVRRYGGSQSALKRGWANGVSLREGAKKALEELKASHELYLVSNTPLGLVEFLFAQSGLDECFDGLFLSNQLHLAKPDPRFFEEVEKRIPEEQRGDICYFDDNPENIDAGKKRGYSCFLVGKGGMKEAISAWKRARRTNDVAI